MKYQFIMARALPEEVTQGTLEGDIVPGDITFFRLQSTSDNKLRAYIAQGEVLPVATRPLVRLVSLPSLRWEDFTATYRSKGTTRTTVQSHSVISEKHYMRYSNTSAFL